MALRTESSSPGSCEAIRASAWFTALTQLLVGSSTQVSITDVKPTSLPPTVMDTSVVAGLSADSCELSTVAVVALEHVFET